MIEKKGPAPVIRCSCGVEMQADHLEKKPKEVRCERCGRVWNQWHDDNVVGSVIVSQPRTSLTVLG
jgi:uncharacterized Zn finger protein